jgi:hypothetical protein
MGVHESQSLLWERMIGLSRPFSEYLLPKLQVGDIRVPVVVNSLWEAETGGAGPPATHIMYPLQSEIPYTPQSAAEDSLLMRSCCMMARDLQKSFPGKFDNVTPEQLYQGKFGQYSSPDTATALEPFLLF